METVQIAIPGLVPGVVRGNFIHEKLRGGVRMGKVLLLFARNCIGGKMVVVVVSISRDRGKYSETSEKGVGLIGHLEFVGGVGWIMM